MLEVKDGKIFVEGVETIDAELIGMAFKDWLESLLESNLYLDLNFKGNPDDCFEIWKDVKGFEGFYRVSTLGRIKSMERYFIRKNNVKVLVKEKILNGWNAGEGYIVVDLKKEGKSLKRGIHKIVGDNFLGLCVGDQMINHKNGIRHDNRLNNLEKVTSRENNCHRVIGKKKYSNLIGVSKSNHYNRKKPWTAQITVNCKPIHLGYFATEQEAYEARCNYEKENNIINRYL